MKLSAYILVKNNARFIRYAIESIYQHVDELVIVDSGSTDDTLDIAREYTNKIFFRELDDFSTQRNFAIQQCRGEWIFFLDADEVMGRNFPQAIKYLGKDYRSIIIPRYNLINLDPMLYLYNTPHHHYHDWQTRFFRNDGQSFFYLPVHHQLTNNKPRLKLSFINIFHFHWLLNDRDKREKRVAFYDQIDKGSGGHQYYIFEDYPYCTAEVNEYPEDRIINMLKRDDNFLSYRPNPVVGGQFKENVRYNTYKWLTNRRFDLNI